MSYKKVGWEDSPSSNTPILSVSLNQMDDGIEKANKGIVFSYSATFTADNVLKNTRQTDALGVGDFATSQTDITTAYVSNAVTKIGSGTFSNCTLLKTIYIDNTVGNVEIVSGAVPDGVSIVYSNDDNFINVNELLASAIKSLKQQVSADKSDWENRATSIEAQHKTDVQALTDKANSIVEQANTDRKNFNNSVDEINTKLETPLADIESLKSGKLDKTDFNSYKTSNDNAVNSKVDTTDFNTYKTATDTAINANASSIAEKFDRTNVENGTGNIYMQNSEIAGTFSYFKVGDLVVLQLKVSNLPTNVGYLYCFGLPFRAKDSNNLYRFLVTTNAGDMIKIAIQDNHIHLSQMAGNFKDGCIVTTTVSYLI